MESIDLLRCQSCLMVFDQWTMVTHATKRACQNRFVLVVPTKWHKFCWFINQPIHVIALFIKDFREKHHEA